LINHILLKTRENSLYGLKKAFLPSARSKALGAKLLGPFSASWSGNSFFCWTHVIYYFTPVNAPERHNNNLIFEKRSKNDIPFYPQVWICRGAISDMWKSNDGYVETQT
jgi:hypothetical protein